MMTRLLYRLQKDNRYKPLVVALTLFAGIGIISLVILRGTGVACTSGWALAYALAGYSIFLSGRRVIYFLSLTVPLSLLIFAALKLWGNISIPGPGLASSVILMTVLLVYMLFRDIPGSPKVIFVTLFSGGLASALSCAFLLCAFH